MTRSPAPLRRMAPHGSVSRHAGLRRPARGQPRLRRDTSTLKRLRRCRPTPGVAVVTCMDSRIDPLGMSAWGPVTPRSSATPAGAWSTPAALEAIVLGLRRAGCWTAAHGHPPHSVRAVAATRRQSCTSGRAASAGQEHPGRLQRRATTSGKACSTDLRSCALTSADPRGWRSAGSATRSDYSSSSSSPSADADRQPGPWTTPSAGWRLRPYVLGEPDPEVAEQLLADALRRGAAPTSRCVRSPARRRATRRSRSTPTRLAGDPDFGATWSVRGTRPPPVRLERAHAAPPRRPPSSGVMRAGLARCRSRRPS